MRDVWSLSNALSSLLLALTLSLIIWVAAANNDLERVTSYPSNLTRGIPIDLINVPPGMIVTEGEQERVQVDLLIHEERRSELEPDDFMAYADLSGLSEGLHRVEVIVEEQPFAPNLRLLRWNPSRISVRLDRERTMELPIQVDILDMASIAPNYQVLTSTLTPPTLTVTGPATLLEPVASAVVELELEGAREQVVRRIIPELRDAAGNVVNPDELRFGVSSVEVTVPIEQRPGYRELIVSTVITGTTELSERGFWISRTNTNPNLVAVVGRQGVVDELNGIVNTAPVDVSDLKEGLAILPVPLQLPDGVSPVATNDTVTVTISVEPQTGSKTVMLEPTVSGLAPGLVVTDSAIVPPTLDVLLRGPVIDLQNLNLDEVSAVLDLTSRGIGTYLIEPRITVPGTLRAESIIPEQVEVTVAEERVRQQVPLTVRAIGLPPNTYAALEPRTLTVTLVGPASVMSSLSLSSVQAVVDVRALEEAGLREGAQVFTPTINVGERISVTRVQPEQVRVRLFDEDQLEITTVPVEVVNLEPGLSASLTSNIAVLRLAPEDDTLVIDPQAIAVTVDLAGRGVGEYELRPSITLPEGYELVSLLPERYLVRVEEAE